MQVSHKVSDAPVRLISLEEMRGLVGKPVGESPWLLVDQERIDAFAEVTGDDQFIHVDPELAAARAPFGGTIAHGFLTVSLLVQMAISAVPRLDRQAAMVNLGFDKLRFLTPVKAGSRVRGRFTLAELNEKMPGQLMLRYAVSVEIEGEDRLAMVAHWLTLALFDGEDEA